MAFECLGKPKCELFNYAGYHMCQACGYQEDENYSFDSLNLDLSLKGL